MGRSVDTTQSSAVGGCGKAACGIEVNDGTWQRAL